MADFTALKTAIQNAIKQNGNEEITGNLLQEVLLAIVTTLGDGSINELITALGTEATNREQADGTLQQNINAEAQARQLGDSTLQGGINTAMQAINAINNAIDNGCVYAGIATPSTTPAAGKVFYLALTAGTYTNFNGLEVSQGINILKNNGSTWSLDSFVGIDDAPAPSSQKLVKSGGVFDEVMKNGSAFDLSAYNGGATYADLNAALTALNALPAAYKRGGMSMKFVLSSDNKYVQYRLMSTAWSTDVANWQGVDTKIVEGSHNLVESGAVYELQQEVSSFTFIGKGSEPVLVKAQSLIAGRTYKLSIENPNWSRSDIGTDTSSFILALSFRNSNGGNIYRPIDVRNTSGAIIDSDYNFEIPANVANYAYFEIVIRADVGEIVRLRLDDITDVSMLDNSIPISTCVCSSIFNFDTITHKLVNSEVANLAVFGKKGRIARIQGLNAGDILTLPTSSGFYYIVFNTTSREFRYNTTSDISIQSNDYVFAIIHIADSGEIDKVITTLKYTINGNYPDTTILDAVPNNIISFSWADFTIGNIRASSNLPTEFVNNDYVLRTNRFYRFSDYGGKAGVTIRSTITRQDGYHWDARIMLYNRKFEFVGYISRASLPITFSKYSTRNTSSPLVNTSDTEAFFFKIVLFLYNGTTQVSGLTPSVYTDGEIELSGCLDNTVGESVIRGRNGGIVLSTGEFFEILKSRGTLVASGLQKEIQFNSAVKFLVENIKHDIPQPMKLSFIGRRTDSTSNPDIQVSINGLHTISPIILENDQNEIKEYILPPSILNGGQIYIQIAANTAFTKFVICEAKQPPHHSEILFESHLGVLYGKNTMAGFAASAQMGFKSCVANLRHTLDNVLVCAHNDAFVAASDGQTYSISELTYDQINALGFYETRTAVEGEPDQKFWYDWFGGQKIVKVDEFLQLCKQTSMMPIFSIHDTVFDFADLKALTDKWGYTDDDSIMIKTSISRYADNVTRSITVFGHIAQYNIGGKNNVITQAVVDAFCTDAAGLTRWVECEGDITDENLAIVLNSGCKAMLFDYQFKDTKWYRDYIKKGVTAFTVDRFYNDGLAW